MTTVRIQRRAFLTGLGASMALLAACSGQSAAPVAKPDAPKPADAKPAEAKPAESKPAAAAQPAQSAPASKSGNGKAITFWGRTQFLPESNAWLTDSVKMAAQEGGFEVKIDMF